MGERDELLFLLPSDEARESLAPFSTVTLREVSFLPVSARVDALAGVKFCEWDETILRDYCRLWYLRIFSLSRIQQTTDLLKSLQFYPELTTLEDRYYPAERKDQAVAILTVIAHQKLHGAHGWHMIGSEPEIERYPYIDDAKLRELLLANEYDREMIVTLVLERNIFDGGELARLLEDSHSAMIDGVL
jgi:hypothetical protein